MKKEKSFEKRLTDSVEQTLKVGSQIFIHIEGEDLKMSELGPVVSMLSLN